MTNIKLMLVNSYLKNKRREKSDFSCRLYGESLLSWCSCPKILL